MNIEVLPKTISELYDEFNPTLKPEPDLEYLEFRQYVLEHYNGILEREVRSDYLFDIGWSISFENFQDMVIFCNKFEL